MDWPPFLGGFALGMLIGATIGVLAVGLGLQAKNGERPHG